jgi:hypothetical protein
MRDEEALGQPPLEEAARELGDDPDLVEEGEERRGVPVRS